jgi:hypothetical protein
MGDYFARKNLIMSIVSVLPILIAAYILNIIKSSETLIGFSVIFIFAALFRFISGTYLNKMSKTENKEYIVKETKNITRNPFFKTFKKKVLKDKFFLKFLIFVIVFYFSLYIGTLYLSYFLLHTLSYSYVKYTWWSIACILGNIVSLRYWGYVSDKFGSLNILKNTIYFIPLFILIPAIFYKFYFVLLIISFFGGVVLAGFNLSIINYFYQYVKTDLIYHYSVFLIIQSTALFVGTMFGSLIIDIGKRIFNIELYALIFVFIVSAIFRFISIFFIKNLKDVKRKEKSIWKDIIFLKPVSFGLHQFGYYFLYEEKKAIYTIDKEKGIILNKLSKKDNKKLNQKIKSDERKIKKEIKKIITEEKALIDKFKKE